MEKFSPWCLLNDYPDEGDLEAVLFEGSKVYFINKVFDLFDTIFFVLRKKFNQVTFLHVYHHVAMCLVVWAHFKFNHLGGE
ncbi:hypothetical protein R5R35_010369 [Gryllus longicercus]|uniref:Elongation of very long chain fatty acids protein n=1 Tax=Gryllus longicercus TaxID=2509291 RepID=A0AAN9ZE45_9ORTH